MASLRLRLVVEIAAAAVSFGAFVLTVLWRDWIEIVFGIDPDHHSGLAEWLILGILVAVALIVSALARSDWQRLRAAPGNAS